MTIEILEPHGFCAGVKNALQKARALVTCHPQPSAAPVYCLHELVHNELVVADLKSRGLKFVVSLSDVPEGSIVLFSAHGVSPSVRAEAAARKLKVVDATCPFVARVHQAASEFASRGLQVVVIGHPDHAEVKGITGEVPDPIVINDSSYTSLATAKRPLGVVSQTTMNADDVAAVVERLRQTFVVESTAEVCRATKERQDAVKAFDGDALLVLGSAQSSNTKRLCEVAHCRTFRAGTMADLRDIDFSGIGRLGVTSGASTPEEFFSQAVDWLRTQEDT